MDYTSGAGGTLAANNAPAFDAAPLLQATVGQPYAFDAHATDADGDSVFYFLASGPAGMTVDPLNGHVEWVPDDHAAARTNVILHAYDTRGGRGQLSFVIEVAGTNQAPIPGTLPELIQGKEGVPLFLNLPVVDPEGDPLAVWADYLPPGAILDPAALRFTWAPDFDSAGTYQDVTFHFSDGINEVTRKVTFQIAPTDQPPVLIVPAERTLREGDHLRFYLNGYDPDGQAVHFESYLLPPGAKLDPNTGLFDWTPDYYMAGTYQVPFTVTNGTQRVTKTTTFTVLNANGAPVIDVLDGARLFEGQPFVISAFAYDPDNPGYEHPYRDSQGNLVERDIVPPSVTVSASNLPAGASFDPVTTFLSWTPDYTQAGTYHITFTAIDDGDGTGVPLMSSTTIEVVVLEPEPRP